MEALETFSIRDRKSSCDPSYLQLRSHCRRNLNPKPEIAFSSPKGPRTQIIGL